MSENNSSDTRVSPTASYLAVDADFNTLMDELTLEAEGQVELAATAREQALMDHQHKFYGSEAKAQPRQMIRETGRGVMESSETIARVRPIGRNSSRVWDGLGFVLLMCTFPVLSAVVIVVAKLASFVCVCVCGACGCFLAYYKQSRIEWRKSYWYGVGSLCSWFGSI